MAACNAGYPGQISHRYVFFEAGFHEQLATRNGLVVAVLEKQRPASVQVCPRTGDDGADRIEAIVAVVGQFGKRLIAQIALYEMFVGTCDVGRIGNDQIEPAAVKIFKPVTFDEFHGCSQAARILGRDRQGCA